MEPIYFFCEPAIIRVPLFSYDRRLFGLLAASGDGIWDNTRQEFVFKLNESAAVLGCGLSGIICVIVDESSPVPVRVCGFWERLWEEDCPMENPAANKVINKPEQTATFAFTAPSFMCDKLNEVWQLKLETELRSRKYSPHTLDAYIHFNRMLCRIVQKAPEEISLGDVTRFLSIMEKDGYSASAMNLALSAVKFFYKNVLKNDSIREQRRPRQDRTLPSVLSKNEIKKIINMEKNQKHRLLLMLIYSSGLRVSEAVILKREHIDFSRKVVYIKTGKGRKDRPVHHRILQLLRHTNMAFPRTAGKPSSLNPFRPAHL
jgi:hypothetical protein